MLLSITTEYHPATDLGYLLHKNPLRCQAIDLNFGSAYVFYPEATKYRCTASLLLNIDPIGMVRGKKTSITSGPLDQYVNDRPYVASSFLSVAIANVFGSALKGRCNAKPKLAERKLPLTARISVLPCRGGEPMLKALFEPLGYEVTTTPHILDPEFETWGNSIYMTVILTATITLKDLLTHLYVLIPVLDNNKHYYVGEAELENLLLKGKGWLGLHPQKELIAKRYLKHRFSLARQALSRLMVETPSDTDENLPLTESREASLEKPMSLNEIRIKSVIEKIIASKAARVIDLGCGEGKLLKSLIKMKSIEHLAGMDVSIRSLEIAHRRLGLDRLPEKLFKKISLFHGSLMYRDQRMEGFDAAVVIEVIEHLDPPRLRAFESVLFENARPETIILTTPNYEYNRLWGMPEGAMRHSDHRFEWTREEFFKWGERIAKTYLYTISFHTIGPEDETYGSPTQMGVFKRAD